MINAFAVGIRVVTRIISRCVDEMRDEVTKKDKPAKPEENMSQSRNDGEKCGARAMTSHVGDDGKPK